MRGQQGIDEPRDEPLEDVVRCEYKRTVVIEADRNAIGDLEACWNDSSAQEDVIELIENICCLF